MAEFDAKRVGEAIVLGQLTAVIGLDAVAREPQRIERGWITSRRRGIQFGLRDAQADGPEIDAVEFPGELEECRIAPRRHIGDDRAYRLFNVSGGLPLG